MDIFIVIAFFGIMIASWCWVIYNNTSHSKTNGKVLKKDAIICDIKTDNVGGRKLSTASIRTTITFDDGFIYISHKSQMRMDTPLFLSGTIYVDRRVIDEIKKDAIAAHKKAYDRQCLNNSHDFVSKDEDNVETKSISTTIESTVHNVMPKNIEHKNTIDGIRLKQVINILTFAEKFIEGLKIDEKFSDVQEEVMDCINNDLLVFEMLFQQELYNPENEKTRAILVDLNIKAVSIALYSILDLSKDFPNIRLGEIYDKISKILYQDIQTENVDIFCYEKNELKKYFVDSINSNIGGN